MSIRGCLPIEDTPSSGRLGEGSGVCHPLTGPPPQAIAVLIELGVRQRIGKKPVGMV
ncbi:MAG: hypothetical protein IGR80_11005 [Synechococcales cyanobacterium K44_A2020_017]|uniref:hypothetical protein n=1 Tax=Leptolyngbya sp. CCY15150 TaxID=2767772 RepID=UPI00195237B1|nr:hypothetical protein [Leptolyngbya sp. CCY15150]MBF2095272.1 hypothetical protein [Synechococcales cyanobacterium K44_A2020_017]